MWNTRIAWGIFFGGGLIQLLTGSWVVGEPVSADQKRFTNSIGMEFVLIPAGRFLMGSPPGGIYEQEKKVFWKGKWIKPLSRDADEIQHEVIVSKPFFMQVTEVTQQQWKAVMGNNPAYFKKCGEKSKENCPVERVSWFDAARFVERLNKRGEGVYRLPTEAEWEYSARAGTKTAFSWGNKVECTMAMFQNNTRRGWDYCVSHVESRGLGKNRTAPVRSYPPNPWGLFDMHGNVWEWCQDWYGPYPKRLVRDPKGPEKGGEKVRRGGSWFGEGTLCRSANRNRSHPASRYRTTGFRVVREYP